MGLEGGIWRAETLQNRYDLLILLKFWGGSEKTLKFSSKVPMSGIIKLGAVER